MSNMQESRLVSNWRNCLNISSKLLKTPKYILISLFSKIQISQEENSRKSKKSKRKIKRKTKKTTKRLPKLRRKNKRKRKN